MATNTKFVWLENLNSEITNFTNDTGHFSLAPHGTQDNERSSVAQVKEEIADEPFVQRAIRRGRLQILTRAEAQARLGELERFESEKQDEISMYLEEGADHLTDHFKKPLPEDAYPTGPGRTAREIFANNPDKKAAALLIRNTRSDTEKGKDLLDHFDPHADGHDID